MLTHYINIERIIHSIKTVIACILGLFLVKLIGLRADQWVIITILVVMCAQIYVGSVMQKAYLRFLGTLIGCLFAALAILVMGDSYLTVIITIAVSSFIFSYIATLKESLTYAATLGAVTTAIIMLGQTPTLDLAFERFLEISLGVLIAALVSQFVLPIRASVHLRRTQALTLKKLSYYYQQTVITQPSDEQEINYQDLDEEIVKSLLKQRELAKESASEKWGPAFSTAHFMQSLYSEREILRAITFMHTAMMQDRQTKQLLIDSTHAQAFHTAVLESLKTLITALNSDTNTPPVMTLPSTLMIKEDIKNQSWPNDMIYLDGFLFTAEVLINSIATLANLYRVNIKMNA